MNEELVELVRQGQALYRQLLGGKHLRPAELALMVYVVAIEPEWAGEAQLDHGKQSRWEQANGST